MRSHRRCVPRGRGRGALHGVTLGGAGRMVHQPRQHAGAVEGRGQLDEHLTMQLLHALSRQ
jgi:hypothetical protein